MGFRDKLKRLEQATRGQLSHFELEDGTCYWFEPQQALIETYLHTTRCLRADFAGEPRPEAPELLTAISRAKNRRAALEAAYEEPWKAFIAYDLTGLIERGELVPRSMVVGKELGQELEYLGEA